MIFLFRHLPSGIDEMGYCGTHLIQHQGIVFSLLPVNYPYVDFTTDVGLPPKISVVF